MKDHSESVQKLPGKLKRLSFPPVGNPSFKISERFPPRRVAEETGQAGWTD